MSNTLIDRIIYMSSRDKNFTYDHGAPIVGDYLQNGLYSRRTAYEIVGHMRMGDYPMAYAAVDILVNDMQDWLN